MFQDEVPTEVKAHDAVSTDARSGLARFKFRAPSFSPVQVPPAKFTRPARARVSGTDLCRLASCVRSVGACMLGSGAEIVHSSFVERAWKDAMTGCPDGKGRQISSDTGRGAGGRNNFLHGLLVGASSMADLGSPKVLSTNIKATRMVCF